MRDFVFGEGFEINQIGSLIKDLPLKQRVNTIAIANRKS